MKSSMSDRFLDWLDECPAHWFLIRDDGDGHAEYSFNTPEEEDDNND